MGRLRTFEGEGTEEATFAFAFALERVALVGGGAGGAGGVGGAAYDSDVEGVIMK